MREQKKRDFFVRAKGLFFVTTFMKLAIKILWDFINAQKRRKFLFGGGQKDVIVNSIENRYAETLLSEERKVSAPS